ncbi:hypothetical protein V6U90_31365 [Micromonospora sp. CPCC 206060]
MLVGIDGVYLMTESEAIALVAAVVAVTVVDLVLMAQLVHLGLDLGA